MLVVVLVSAAIRLDVAPGALGALRAVHRTAASLEALLALWLAWQAWRGRVSGKSALLVLALTAFLSLLGIVAGKTPAPLQSLGNLLGGLALLAAFAWLLGKKGSGPFFQKWVLTPLFLLAAQSAVGGRLSIFGRTELPALPVHAELGLVLAALLAWLALARVGGGTGKLLFALALAAPVAGFSALHYEYSAAAALVHAASAALLVAASAFALSRKAFVLSRKA